VSVKARSIFAVSLSTLAIAAAVVFLAASVRKSLEDPAGSPAEGAPAPPAAAPPGGTGRMEVPASMMGALDPDELSVGDPAPDFTLPAPSGGEVRLSSFRGKIPVVLVFGSFT
jgi:hypothetical protein